MTKRPAQATLLDTAALLRGRRKGCTRLKIATIAGDWSCDQIEDADRRIPAFPAYYIYLDLFVLIRLFVL